MFRVNETTMKYSEDEFRMFFVLRNLDSVKEKIIDDYEKYVKLSYSQISEDWESETTVQTEDRFSIKRCDEKDFQSQKDTKYAK